MRNKNRMVEVNTKLAQEIWDELPSNALNALKVLTTEHNLSVANGDLQLLDGRWYVTHSGLLRLARRCGCSGILTALDGSASNPPNNCWVFKATVYKTSHSKGFVGYGDANPVMSLPSSEARRCVSLRREPSTELSGKPTESVSARSKSWDGRPTHQVPPIATRDQINRALRMVQAMVTRGSATNSACWFANTNSTLPW